LTKEPQQELHSRPSSLLPKIRWQTKIRLLEQHIWYTK
jgi:hypothetical protein